MASIRLISNFQSIFEALRKHSSHTNYKFYRCYPHIPVIGLGSSINLFSLSSIFILWSVQAAKFTKPFGAQSAGATEYTDCVSAER